MPRRSSRPRIEVTAFEAAKPAGAAGLVIDGFHPVRSRWTWQPLLPELWLREQERRHFPETTLGLKKKV